MKIGIRVWILIIALILSLLAISPSFKSGIKISSVDRDSQLFEEGLRAGNIITAINGQEISSKAEYTSLIENSFDGNQKRWDITTKNGEYTILSNESLGISVEDIPMTRIKTGLDLRGGARALVQADQPLDDNQIQDLISVSSNRFNVYGLSDIQIRSVRDLEGNRFMLVEVAGATPDDLEDLIAKQGSFEAKVGNDSVFTGDSGDIADVCRNDASCAGVTNCGADGLGGYVCSFRFAIYLTEDAANKHAELTGKLGYDETGKYLSQKLYLYVDEVLVDELFIGADLKGQATTSISIQGSGSGTTQEDALKTTRENMNRLQTILITGSLPYKLEIVKLDTISPTLGNQFNKILLIAGALAILIVAIIIFIRYRNIKASLALLLTSFSELIIILGVAALIGWNLDLPSIAGILATIGTGVDSQIVILDETRKNREVSVRERVKRALFVIISAYAASLASLIPLYWAGAGLFKGFALTTIIGITAGVFISRPAFAEIIRKMEE